MVALSSYESVYMAVSYVSCQVIWIRFVLDEMEVEVKKPLVFKIENKLAINFIRNEVLHGKSKHINLYFTSYERR